MFPVDYLEDYKEATYYVDLPDSGFFLDGRRENALYSKAWFQKKPNIYSDGFRRKSPLETLYYNNCILYINSSGKYTFQISPDTEPMENISALQLKEILFAIDKITLADNSTDNGFTSNCIHKHELIIVSNSEYNPHKPVKFYLNKFSSFTMNLYEPSYYLRYPHNKPNDTCPDIYKKLYSALTGNDIEANYMDEAISRHFQTFNANNKNFVFNGHNTEVTDIWYEYVLKPLYGEKNTSRITDEELDKEFSSKVENKLIVNISKIPSDADNMKIMNKQLKKLIKEKDSYTLLIFTTVETYGLDIDRNSEDYTVFTQSDISKDYLGYGSYTALGQALKKELYNFSDYMYNKTVDKELIKNSLPTEAKDLLLKAPLNRVDSFIKAVQTKDTEYFISLNNTIHTELYIGLREDINKNIISKSSLAPLFNALEDTEFSAKAFLEKLRSSSKLNKKFFDRKNSKGTDTGDELFIIDSEHNEYFISE